MLAVDAAVLWSPAPAGRAGAEVAGACRRLVDDPDRRTVALRTLARLAADAAELEQVREAAGTTSTCSGGALVRSAALGPPTADETARLLAADPDPDARVRALTVRAAAPTPRTRRRSGGARRRAHACRWGWSAPWRRRSGSPARTTCWRRTPTRYLDLLPGPAPRRDDPGDGLRAPPVPAVRGVAVASSSRRSSGRRARRPSWPSRSGRRPTWSAGCSARAAEAVRTRYALLAAADAVARRTGRPRARRLTKPLLMPSLAPRRGAPTRTALLLGGVGDVALLGSGPASFTAGLSAFLAGHVGVGRGAAPPPGRAPARAAVRRDRCCRYRRRCSSARTRCSGDGPAATGCRSWSTRPR